MYYVGMMSGTSLDGIDAVLAAYSPDEKQCWAVEQHVSIAIPEDVKTTLYQLNFPSSAASANGLGELHAAKTAEQQLTHCYTRAYRKLMQASGVDPAVVVALGAHGQTIRHEPNAEFPYTVQLLNGALLSHLCQQTVVCDFRSKDIAAGGQGAPLAPLFHQQLFPSIPSPFAVVNIGGIANISVIDNSATPTLVYGFDCGAGNCLMDEWIFQHCGKAYDENGSWARGGRVLPQLLSRFLSDEYFALPMPKSTGRDYFNFAWLHRYLHGDESPQDVMRTLNALSATAIVEAVPSDVRQVIIVGGGSKNALLCETISNQLQQRGGRATVEYGEHLAIDAQHVEALGFALLAKACVEGRALPTAAVTGANVPVICGAIYQH